MEIVTHVLSGAHDIDQISGSVTLYSADSKEEFPGMRGTPFHTYPGDFCGRDEKGIVFSLIAGADERTCARMDSRHVFYPIFGTPDLDVNVIRASMDTLVRYIRVLSPEADIFTGIL
jgi:DNA/RNA-binding domain of Phe-tRNA-synthetase-like protein